jgi:hypothetical protein
MPKKKIIRTSVAKPEFDKKPADIVTEVVEEAPPPQVVRVFAQPPVSGLVDLAVIPVSGFFTYQGNRYRKEENTPHGSVVLKMAVDRYSTYGVAKLTLPVGTLVKPL